MNVGHRTKKRLRLGDKTAQGTFYGCEFMLKQTRNISQLLANYYFSGGEII